MVRIIRLTQIDDYDFPFLKEFGKWKEKREKEYPVSDGFDLAYFQGIEIIEKEFNNWDGGISENFLRGIEDAIKQYKKMYKWKKKSQVD